MKKIKLLLTCLLGIISNQGFSQSVGFIDASTDYGLVFGTYDTAFGTGISFYDFNKDGFDDISVTGSAGNPCRFYTSTGDSLEQVSMTFNLSTDFTTSILWADFSNDQNLDLSATHDDGPIQLFENQGGFNFTQIGQSNGISGTHLSSYGSAWADYDVDGDIDLYVSNRSLSGSSLHTNVLYKNLGSNQFTDVADEALVQDDQGMGYGVVFTDFDKDGLPDIYLSNDKFITRNTLYHNLGDGTFEDVSESSGSDFYIDGMGIAPGDIDGDGFEDLYLTNTPQSSFDFGGNIFLLNQTDGTFHDDAENLNTRVYKWGWGCSFADFNNDGHLDLFVANEGETGLDTNILYINQGDGTFYEDTLSNIYHAQGNSFGSAVGDVNDDGAMDIIVVNYNPTEVKLWLNSGSSNGWAKFTLEGTESNSEAIGSWVEVYTNGNAQYRYKRCGTSYCSQDGRAVHFGLGAASIIDSVKVIWPTQTSNTYYNLAINQTHHIIEPSVVTASPPFSERNSEVSAYPNPVGSGLLHIDLTSELDQNCTLELLAADGKLCKTWSNLRQGKNKSLILSLPEVATGTYILSCRSGGRIIWNKQLQIE